MRTIIWRACEVRPRALLIESQEQAGRVLDKSSFVESFFSHAKGLICSAWLAGLILFGAAGLVGFHGQALAQGQPGSVQPATYEQALTVGYAALNRGDQDEAIKQANAALSMRPGDAAAKDLLLRASLRKATQPGQPSTIPPVLTSEKPSSSQPQQASQEQRDRDIGIALARKAINSGNYDQAIELLTLVVRGWPDDKTAAGLLSQARQAKANKQGGTGDYAAALAAGRTALEAGDNETAIAKANEALKARPGDSAAMDLLLLAQMRKGKEPAASPTPAAKVEEPPQTPPPGETEETPSSEKVAQKPPPNNEISVSGDFLFGQGKVTVPFGYSLAQSVPGASVETNAQTFKRSSTYFGGTVSYSYGQRWFVEFSYSQGHSSGQQDINPHLFEKRSLISDFTIDDTWYQIYLKYAFQAHGRPFSAYVRAGASFVHADLDVKSVNPVADIGRYHQTDSTEEVLGNLGFGMAYALKRTGKFRVSLQLEGEGFYGTRSQNSLETLSEDFDLAFQTAHIHNTLYGGIARGTVRAQYELGSKMKIFGDAGAQGMFTMIDYPGVGSNNELLWGPYVKIGLRIDF